jgi:hypothetical protein
VIIQEGMGLSALLLVALAFGLAESPNRSGFVGTWKMDPAKSDFGSGPVSASRLDRITYAEPNLKDTITQRLRGPENTYDMNYTTDGKECTNKVRGNTVKSTAHWEGEELVIDSKVYALREQDMHDRYTLSADGKTLTLLRHMTGHFNTDQKIVFDRQ